MLKLYSKKLKNYIWTNYYQFEREKWEEKIDWDYIINQPRQEAKKIFAQTKLQESIDDSRLFKIREHIQNHPYLVHLLQTLQEKGTGAWLQVSGLIGALELSPAEYQHALRTRLGLYHPLTGLIMSCSCGKRLMEEGWEGWGIHLRACDEDNSFFTCISSTAPSHGGRATAASWPEPSLLSAASLASAVPAW